MSDQRCPKCGNYTWHDDTCKFCGYTRTTQLPKLPPQKSSNIDIEKLHKLVIKETEEKIRQSIPRLSDCILYCHQHSLFYDWIHKQFECLNPDCEIYGKPILYGTQPYVTLINEMQRNHLIKPIKMKRFEYEIYITYLKKLHVKSVIRFDYTIID
jgi:hypothetical protein